MPDVICPEVLKDSFAESAAPPERVVIHAKVPAYVFLPANSANPFGEFALPAQGRPVIPTVLANWLSAFATRHVKSISVVGFTHSLHCRWLTAYRALQFWPSTAAAKLFTVFGMVIRYRARIAAFFALARNFAFPPLCLIVVLEAKSQPEVTGTADFATGVRLVNFLVSRSVGAQLQVLRSIVVANTIDVMRFFRPKQSTPDLVLQHDSMLAHISPPVGVGALKHLYANVTVRVFELFSRLSIWPALVNGGGFHGSHCMS